MNAAFDDEQTTLSHALDQVIAQHGRLRVLLALMLRLPGRRAERAVAALPLNAHLRRDIGLAEMDYRLDLPHGVGGILLR